MWNKFRDIGRRIKETRRQKRVTQAYLAEQIEMSPTYISHIETGKKHVSLGALMKISKALGTTECLFLCGNQAHDSGEWQSDFAKLTQDCTNQERKIVYDIMVAAKNSLRNNPWSAD